jgi:hypothetical protein
MKTILFLLLGFYAAGAVAQPSWQSAHVQVSRSGSIKYLPDSKGNIIPDFSRVGYLHGKQTIPFVAPVRTLAPSENDQQNIQQAIDELSKVAVGTNGFRGAILLKTGTYKIPGSIRINVSGIVLRGEQGTKLIATGRGKRDLIQVNGKGSPQEVEGTRTKIRDTYVATGAKSFRIAKPGGLKKGDRIMLFQPLNEQWIADIKMNRIEKRDDSTKQWTPAEYKLHFEREITAMKGDTVFIDNPVMMPIEEKYGGAEVYVYRFNERLSNVGIENLELESEYTGEEVEDHGWVGIYFNRIENGWVRGVTARYFGYSGVNLGSHARNITVIDCRYLLPKSKITGSRRYSFNNDGQQNLFRNCEGLEGRHDFITGARVCGPNVFVDCKAVSAKADIGPHHRWAVGTLYDNVVTDGEINVQDRGNWGTGHGWAGVTQVLWNCTAQRAAVQSPWASGKNYNIGFKGEKYSGRLSGRPDGSWEGHNKGGLIPRSLFYAQQHGGYNNDNAHANAEAVRILKPFVLKEAAWALKQTPVTITAYRATRSAGGIHDFYSEGDYWWPNPVSPDSPYIQKDGMTNPDNFTAHREAMIRFSRIVGALASAYKLTGDKKYVTAALKHCRAWFINAPTRMNPSLLYAQAIKGRATGRGIGIIDTIHFMEVVQALLAMKSSGVIAGMEWARYQDWFAAYLEWLTTHKYGIDEMNAKNNHGTCWVMQVAVFARFTENKKLLDFCRDRYKSVLLPGQMDADGSFPLELRRTKPYGYSIFNLDAMATICQVLSTTEDDLWCYTTVDGRSMQKGIEFLYPFIADKNSWSFSRDVMYWDQWPVAQPFLFMGAAHFGNRHWFETWKKLDHAPAENEVIRNLPVRNPLIW